MNIRNRFTTALALGIVALAAIFSMSFARPARADRSDIPRRQLNATPPVTLGDGQTLHVTYLNAGGNPFEIIPCVLDGDGAHLKMGDVLTLSPGAMRSFDIGRAEAGRRTEPSVAVRAAVHVDEQNLKNLSVSGEVIEDATGKSTIFLAGLQNPPDSVRGSSAANLLSPVGITFGQTLHVTFLNVGSNPFEIIPCIFDGDGAHMTTGDTITLLPSQMRSFDLSRSEIGGRTESRVQVRAAAHVQNADLKNLVMTGEVIEDTTSKSSLFVPGIRIGFDPQPDPPSPN
ncbi:MAG: hypothetical protein ABJA18_04385 [bacterium]